MTSAARIVSQTLQKYGAGPHCKPRRGGWGASRANRQKPLGRRATYGVDTLEGEGPTDVALRGEGRRMEKQRGTSPKRGRQRRHLSGRCPRLAGLNPPRITLTGRSAV